MSTVNSNLQWDNTHILKIGNDVFSSSDIKDEKFKEIKSKIEPWLTAVFQSENLSLLAGTGLTSAITNIAGLSSQGMCRIHFDNYGKQIKERADQQAIEMNRGAANIEDDIRVAIELYKGLVIHNLNSANALLSEINSKLKDFIKGVLKTEKDFLLCLDCEEKNKLKIECDRAETALSYLKSFLISFSSRTASRNRLNIFTTNYDRFIEYAFDMAGILTLDNFVGKINPVFRSNRISLDYHYNPPGIRGEPRYVEGVVRYTKLHGSLDWKFDTNKITKILLPFGADENHPALPGDPFEKVVIYPNSSKNIETIYFPYADLFRDFSNATCQPNSTVITYGYGFGDSHINKVLEDMLSIPSTHLVIISWDKANGRIEKFVERNNPSQFTLLIGEHFGDLTTLVDNYLPKAAIDRITERRQKIAEKRGDSNQDQKELNNGNEENHHEK